MFLNPVLSLGVRTFICKLLANAKATALLGLPNWFCPGVPSILPSYTELYRGTPDLSEML